MKKDLATGVMKKYLAAGVALILLTNLVALAGVWYNRSDKARYQLTLTERELNLPYSYQKKENSGMTLTLRWRTSGDSSNWRWSRKLNISKERFLQFGFKLSEGRVNTHYVRASEGFAVLELAGETYKNQLTRMQHSFDTETPFESNNVEPTSFEPDGKEGRPISEKELTDFKTTQTRLYVIDVGIDAAALDKQYPDKDKYAVVGAIIRPSYNSSQNSNYNSNYSGDEWSVRVDRLLVGQINVPAQHRGFLDSIQLSDHYTSESNSPRYEVDIAWGKRLEPWIKQVRALEMTQSEDNK
jgi:Domain of unknown function (DUF4824)